METAVVPDVGGFTWPNASDMMPDRGYDVRGIDNFSTACGYYLEPLRDVDDSVFHEKDVWNENAIAKLSQGADQVFRQAAISSVSWSFFDPVLMTDAKCNGTVIVIGAPRHANFDTPIFVARRLSMVPPNSYGKSKSWRGGRSLCTHFVGAVFRRYRKRL